MKIQAVVPLAAAAFVAALYFASAADATKDDAVAMVQKAVAAIKSEGAEKAYAEISNMSGPFVKGDLYIAVVGFDGTLLAAVGERVGDNVDLKDSDGKEVVKERIALAKEQPSFWQFYKFINPVTKTTRLDETVVCGGVYQ